MSEEDRDKWNARYAEGAYADRPDPSEWLVAHGALLAELAEAVPTPRALDLACGAGRNAIYLAEAGFSVDAIDISSAGLERARARAGGRPIHWHEHDLEQGLPVLEAGYQLIVVIRYVNLALVPALAELLNPGGVLLCELHMQTEADVAGPSTNAFRVAPGELAAAASMLETIDYREGLVTDPDGRRVALARLAARRSAA